MSWNYRVMRHEIKGSNPTEYWFGIHEVYTDANGKESWTEDNVTPLGETLDGLRWTLERMLDATRKTVVEYEEG